MDDANGVPQDETQQGRGSTLGSTREGVPGKDAVRSIGATLAQARAAAGLTVAEVAERTKIRPGILASIETDAHDQLPALTYTLGFVKAYARTVGIDPADAAARYRLESQKGDPIPTMVDLQPLEEKRLPSRRLVLATGLLLLLALAAFWAWGAGWLTPPPPAPPAANEAEPKQDSLAAEAAAAPSEALPTTAPDSSAPVTLVAREEAWLRISDGNETFFIGTMAAGQTLPLPPGRAWTLRTGRAGALEVKVGSETIPPLGGPAEQVRGLSLAPADLLARKPAGLPEALPQTGGLPAATVAPAG